MIKIMLVEDDRSLREIYGVRLLAEGYDIVSAGDGEEALAMAIKERPHLIISDVMMPKISGFDLLDILRSTTETKNIRVIMMTALSSDDQRIRGEQLGADRYLVKSQVGIEDVVRVVHEVLGDSVQPGPQPVQPMPQPQPIAPQPVMPQPPAPQPPVESIPQPPQPVQTMPQPMPQPIPQPIVQPMPQPQPVAPQPVPAPVTPSQPMPQPIEPASPTPSPLPTPMTPLPSAPPPQLQPQPVEPVTAPEAPPSPLPNPLPQPPPLTPADSPQRSRVISPLNDPSTSSIDMNDLLDKELAKQTGLDYQGAPTFPTTEEEKTDMYDKLDEFQILSAPEPTPAENIPTKTSQDDDASPTSSTGS